MSCSAIVWHLGIFVHFSADSVSNHGSHHAEPVTFCILLYCVRNITKSVAKFELLYTFEKTFSGDFNKFLLFRSCFSNDEGSCCVRLPSAEYCAHVYSNDLSFFKSS